MTNPHPDPHAALAAFEAAVKGHADLAGDGHTTDVPPDDPANPADLEPGWHKAGKDAPPGWAKHDDTWAEVP